MHAAFAAKDFFFANFYPSGPFTRIFFQNLSRVFPVLAKANTGSCVGPQKKKVTLLAAGSRVECSRNIKIGSKTCVVVLARFAFRNCEYNLSCGMRKTDLWNNDLWSENLGCGLKFVFSSDGTLHFSGYWLNYRSFHFLATGYIHGYMYSYTDLTLTYR